MLKELWKIRQELNETINKEIKITNIAKQICVGNEITDLKNSLGN